MSKTRSRPDMPARDRTCERWRAKLVGEIGNIDRLGARDWAWLREIEIFPGSKLGADRLSIPIDWLPYGPLRHESARVLNPTISGVPGPRVTLRDARRDEAIRRCLLILWLPRETFRGTMTCGPSTLITFHRRLIEMASWAVREYPSEEGYLFRHLSPIQVDALAAHFVSKVEVVGPKYVRLLEFLAQEGARGALTDFPTFGAVGDHEGSEEKSWKGVQLAEPSRKRSHRPFQPFPDAFVSALIGRALWIQQNVADEIIDCWASLRDLSGTNGDVTERSLMAVAKHPWRSDIPKLPFQVTMRGAASDHWPPRDADEIARWITILQGLNIHLLAFCTGARKSEIGSATETSLKRMPDGTTSFEGVTYKFSRRTGGKVREWPLHPAGEEALRIQGRLASVVRPADEKYLWVTTREGFVPGRPLLGLAEPCLNTIKLLNLKEEAKSDRAKSQAASQTASDHEGQQDEEHAHLHRWRHTVARLVGLSVVGAPVILLDLFGHHALPMTLGYMLSDRKIKEDAQTIAMDETVRMAEDAIGEILAGKASGPAAPKLHSRLAAAQIDHQGDSYVAETDPEAGSTELSPAMRHGKSSHGYSNFRSLARALTANGRDWQVVRAGVICTKAPGQFGPCTQGKGHPDPGACRTTCLHRLERASAEAQCREAIAFLLVEHARSKDAGQIMLIENWERQIRQKLHSWEGVREEFLKDSEAIRDIWQRGAA